MRFKRVFALLLAVMLLCSACGMTAEEIVDIGTDILDAVGDADGTDAPDVPDVPDVPDEPDVQAPDEQDTPELQVPDEQDGPDVQVPDEQDGPEVQVPDGQDEPDEPDAPAVDRDGYYYDLENVVLYLEEYGELPGNYITKNEARDLGWSGGSVEEYLEGAAIGGDRFGNYEGQLPEAKGRTWTECDIDTLGYGSRGARRLVFSNDGLYYYTSDHYESFTEVTVEDGEVEW